MRYLVRGLGVTENEGRTNMTVNHSAALKALKGQVDILRSSRLFDRTDAGFGRAKLLPLFQSLPTHDIGVRAAPVFSPQRNHASSINVLKISLKDRASLSFSFVSNVSRTAP
ncbi:hypothetical protein RRG08_024600 [Elysia crispata]|uniref:Uncharacterized protein n=1 Tax=Elysia crispata TaxID=231223 RepID=A0AAE0ZWW8_9GAST|nr:hypothetical protein RRG08_024600 [Elysia crispata]